MSKAYKEVGISIRHNGAEFVVWAPFAQSVSLIGSFNEWSAIKMDKLADGYYKLFVKGVVPGQEYKYLIDTGQQLLTRNDPRSYYVSSSAGSSVIPGPLPKHRQADNFIMAPHSQTILYELHIGTFNRTDLAENGSFSTSAEKIEYLSNLGVTALEIMPIHSMYQDRGWGYAPEYLFSVESSYGGRNHFADFIEVAHRANIAVVLDVVYNHLGTPEQTDLWQFDGWSENNAGGIYFYNDWRGVTPWGNTRPDYGRSEVSDYITDNAVMWLRDFKVDGLRLDSTIYMRNVDGQNNKPESDIPDAWELMKKINLHAKHFKPSSLMIAEDAGTNEYITRKPQDFGAGFDAQWDMSFSQALRQILEPTKDEDRYLSPLCTALTKTFNNSAMQRIIFSDSHDTAANHHSRLNQEITPSNPTNLYAKKRSLMAATILLTAPGIPMLLQGQEFMQGGDFNDWQALDWGKVDTFRGIVLAHKHLIALRKNNEGLTTGLTGNNISILHTNDTLKVLAYHRWDKGGQGDDTVIIANFSNRLVSNYYVDFPRVGAWKLRFDSSWHGYSPDFKKYDIGDINIIESGANVNIPPYTVLIYS